MVSNDALGLYTDMCTNWKNIKDENIHPSKMVEILKDEKLADQIAQSAVALYTKASEYAASKGIIIADTKFEFGLDEDNNLVLVDEVLTPGMYRVHWGW